MTRRAVLVCCAVAWRPVPIPQLRNLFCGSRCRYAAFLGHPRGVKCGLFSGHPCPAAYSAVPALLLALIGAASILKHVGAAGWAHQRLKQAAVMDMVGSGGSGGGGAPQAQPAPGTAGPAPSAHQHQAQQDQEQQTAGPAFFAATENLDTPPLLMADEPGGEVPPPLALLPRVPRPAASTQPWRRRVNASILKKILNIKREAAAAGSRLPAHLLTRLLAALSLSPQPLQAAAASRHCSTTHPFHPSLVRPLQPSSCSSGLGGSPPMAPLSCASAWAGSHCWAGRQRGQRQRPLPQPLPRAQRQQ